MSTVSPGRQPKGDSRIGCVLVKMTLPVKVMLYVIMLVVLTMGTTVYVGMLDKPSTKFLIVHGHHCIEATSFFGTSISCQWGKR